MSRSLLLGLIVMWAIIVSACATAKSSAPTRSASEAWGIVPTATNAGLRSDDLVKDGAHRYYDKARRMAASGEWERSVALYDHAIALKPSYSAAYESRAAAYHALGRHEQAIRDYDRAMDLRDDSRLYLQRGHMYLELGIYERADEDYHTAASLGLSSPNVHVGSGDAHRLNGELEETMRSYSEALRLDPDNWRAYYFRGVCYFKLRRFRQAVEDFERAIASRPDDASAYSARGAIRWLTGLCALAVEDFQAFVALSDDGKALSRALEYIDFVTAVIWCEPPPDNPRAAFPLHAWASAREVSFYGLALRKG